MSRPEPGTWVRAKRHPLFGTEWLTGIFVRYTTLKCPEEEVGEIVVNKDSTEPLYRLVIAESIRPAGIQPPESPSVRERVIDEAKKLVTGDRNRSYGSPTQNFRNTADLWTVQFRHKLKDGESFSSSDVASAMIHLKQARRIAGDKEDNWTDTIGYAACGAECDAEDSNG